MRSEKDEARRPLPSAGSFDRLSIRVEHSAHVLRLIGITKEGRPEVLFSCRVGLGGPSFPTPAGVYFVTHIYDRSPLWIPPKNRAWARGQRPSRKIYGQTKETDGTMAPLLKKRTVGSRRRPYHHIGYEDLVSKKVELRDHDYRFHGTNQTRSIGRNQSHGCVRMIPRDAHELAARIKRYVGLIARKESENGSYVVLAKPVRLSIVR
jgi:hypothetical protein